VSIGALGCDPGSTTTKLAKPLRAAASVISLEARATSPEAPLALLALLARKEFSLSTYRPTIPIRAVLPRPSALQGAESVKTENRDVDPL
jgi:hypothetical protein